jgi:hypothetical protein
MNHRQSWFPSMFRDSSRSNSFFKFVFPDSKSPAKETDESVIDNAGQNARFKGKEHTRDR